LFNVLEPSGLTRVQELEKFADFDVVVDQVVEEAGKFAADILSPLNIPGIAGVVVAKTRQSACLSFLLAPMLTSGAIYAIEAHGSKCVDRVA
jgi:hypothetical protein